VSTDRPTTRGAGLRERKKMATRQALSAAAMRLAIERGLENVYVEDIAAAAGVSPRTFSNYFANKYEAICALALDRSHQVGRALREQPAGLNLWDATQNAIRAIYGTATTAPDPAVIAGIRLVTSSPELRGEYLKALSMMQYELAAAITERSGLDPATDTFFTRAFAGAIVSVLQAATERWLFSDPPVPLVPVIEEALRELAEGLRSVLPRSGLPEAAPEKIDEPPMASVS
jgi:AcrR family transcriptional regulator